MAAYFCIFFTSEERMRYDKIFIRRYIRIAMAKAEFNKKKNLFASKLDLNLRKKLVKCCIWSMALCGSRSETRGKF
jgi:hypothetical protein